VYTTLLGRAPSTASLAQRYSVTCHSIVVSETKWSQTLRGTHLFSKRLVNDMATPLVLLSLLHAMENSIRVVKRP